MSEEDANYSDDYIASVLKRDAEASSRKYAAVGLSAYLPTRPTGAAPKPNTRFLRNIIRETDSHNAALLAKEKREARERQKQLNTTASRHRHTSKTEHRNSRHERNGDHSREERRRTRRSPSESKLDDTTTKHHSKRRRKDRAGSRSRTMSRSRSRSRSPRRSSSKKDMRERNGEKRSRHRSKSPERSSRRVKWHRASTDRDRHETQLQDGRHHHRSNSPSMSRSTGRAGTNRESGTTDSDKLFFSKTQTEVDSDPLDDIIGPSPPPRIQSKGRGANRASRQTGIDSHFDDAYNPSLDVQLDAEEEDNWDQALEALRDRQRWKQQGAARLKTAGFTDAEVKKWETGKEKDENDVIWAAKGQGREWDRGKVLDADGMVDLKPSWS